MTPFLFLKADPGLEGARVEQVGGIIAVQAVVMIARGMAEQTRRGGQCWAVFQRQD